jgi:hypothetical protein
MKTITAHATIDDHGWLNIHTKAPVDSEPGEIEAVVVLPGVERHHATSSVEAVACLRKIATAGGLGIKNPVAWQREQRGERPLPGRE